MSTFWTQKGSKYVYIYFSFIVFLCVVYSLTLYIVHGGDGISENDMLNQVFVEDTPILDNFGGWSLSHVITFYIAGLLFPDQWILIFILGVVWELFETILGDALEKFMGKSNNIGNRELLYGDKWLDGNLNDIWSNSLGLFLGYWTSMFLRERREKLNRKS